MMWLCFILPALFGLPLNMYACVSYALGARQEHKKTPMMLKMSNYLALMWTFASVVPSSLLYTDVVCTYDVRIQVGESDTCSFLRGTLCILQSLLYWVLAAVVDLHLAVVNKMGPTARSRYHKFYHAWCWGVPFTMYILVSPLKTTL